MNWLILTPGFPSDEQDTTCIPFLQDLILEMKSRLGAENIRVISFQYPFTEGEYIWNKIHIYAAGGRNRKYIHKWLTWRRVQRQAAKWINKDTVIHSFWLTEAAEIGARLAGKYHCKHICSIMGQDVLLTNPYLQRIPLNEILVVAPNEKTAGYYHIHTALDVADMIPHAIAPVDIVELERNIDLLFVASFIELKQPFVFVDTVANLMEQLPGLKAVMIGNGPMFQQVKDRVQSQQLPLQLMGEIPRSEVHRMMQRSRILLHTSRYEGYSTVISEALSCGCRVVCFDVGRPEVQQGIWLADTAEELPEIILKLLLHEHMTIAADLPLLSETVDRYLKLGAKTPS
jgi:glycosyltransferase involved in cell wall biosynthesis